MTRGRSSRCSRPTSRTPRSPSWPAGCASAGGAALSRPDPSLCRRRRPAPRATSPTSPATPASAARDQRRPLPPSRPAAAAGRASPASASMRGSPRRRRSCSPTPSATSSRRTRWRGCSGTAREALESTLEIVERCRFSLDELAYDYPVQDSYDGRTPDEELARRTWAGRTRALSRTICRPRSSAS